MQEMEEETKIRKTYTLEAPPSYKHASDMNENEKRGQTG